jgi:hypothetical protein
MRSVIFISFMIIALNSCRSGKGEESIPDNDGGVPVISFSELEYDFGKIIEGEKVACIFKFRNTGDADLIIHSATTSCGCTVPRFEDKPIAPGEEGTMEVVFDSYMREGLQTKTITVRSNASVKVVVLRITAEVVG